MGNSISVIIERLLDLIISMSAFCCWSRKLQSGIDFLKMYFYILSIWIKMEERK